MISFVQTVAKVKEFVVIKIHKVQVTKKLKLIKHKVLVYQNKFLLHLNVK